MGSRAPLSGAHVHLSGTFLDYDAAMTRAVGPDGRFRLPIDEAGLYNVFVTAPDHAHLQVPVDITADETVEVEVHLASHPASSLQEVHLVRPGEGRVPMAARDDGTFAVTVASGADTLAYQVAGTTGNRRTVSGTMHDRLVEDGGYDYWSVLDTTPGDSVTVVFHPGRAARGGGESTARFADPASTSARLAAVLREAHRTNVRTVAARDSVLRSHAQPGMIPAAIAPDSTVKAAVRRAVEEGGRGLRIENGRTAHGGRACGSVNATYETMVPSPFHPPICDLGVRQAVEPYRTVGGTRRDVSNAAVRS